MTKTSVDGQAYEVLKSPAAIRLPVTSYRPHSDLGSYTIHHAYVECEKIKSALLPLDSNPREPSGKTGQVSAMRDTLRNHPSEFHKWNNGMTLVCDKVSYYEESKECAIEFGEGEGVCNGGHTYFAIVTTPFVIEPRALVHLELVELPVELEGNDKIAVISDIARTRNNNTRLALTSQADFQGYYNQFKECMDDTTLVRWHENDSAAKPDAIPADHLVRLLASMDPIWYSHPVFNPTGDIHRSAATSVQAIHFRWYDAMEDPAKGEFRLAHMAVLIDDLLSIRDHVSASLKNDPFPRGFRRSSFYNDWLLKKGGERPLLTNRSQKGVGFPNTVDVLFIGLFRSNVWLGLRADGRCAYVGWYLDPTKLWDMKKTEVFQALIDLFNDNNKEPLQFVRAAGPYRTNLFVLGTLASPPLPSTVYDVESGSEYVEDTTAPTHYLDTSGDLELKGITGPITSGLKTFKKV